MGYHFAFYLPQHRQRQKFISILIRSAHTYRIYIYTHSDHRISFVHCHFCISSPLTFDTALIILIPTLSPHSHSLHLFSRQLILSEHTKIFSNNDIFVFYIFSVWKRGRKEGNLCGRRCYNFPMWAFEISLTFCHFHTKALLVGKKPTKLSTRAHRLLENASSHPKCIFIIRQAERVSAAKRTKQNVA